jgi:type II secretory pathway component GspD/PulD (secretin)
MATTDEELEAAKQAQAVISTLSASSIPGPHIVAMLRKAKLAAGPVINFTENEGIVVTRDKVVNALSDLIRALDEGSAPQEKIDKAKDAIEVWMNQLLD